MKSKVIIGSSAKVLGESIAKQSQLECIDTCINKFANGETKVCIKQHIKGADIIIFQSTHNPVNDNLIEALFLIEAAKEHGANKVELVVPYFGYGRQDRHTKDCNVTSMKVVAELLSKHVDRIITVDLHSEQSKSFFNTEVVNVDLTELWAEHIGSNISNVVVVSPDVGGTLRAKKLAKRLDCDFAIIDKSRDINREGELLGDVYGKHCIIVDDIIDTGHTLSSAAALLKKRGALTIRAMIAHAILSNGCKDLDHLLIEEIVVTNSIDRKDLTSQFRVADIAPIISATLRAI